jgi:DNA polymerase V
MTTWILKCGEWCVMLSIPSNVFALVDCNNFFASCERVFNPSLRKRPVVVLSNNDGCVIARSNEAKAVGIPMGAPVFKLRDLVARHNIAICSSNFVLYGDMSQRVMRTLSACANQMEIYSIDEAFLVLDGPGEDDFMMQGLDMRAKVLQHTGLPTSIGIAATKTLAKIANRIAKKNCLQGVFCLLKEEDIEHWLSKTPVEAIWGVGRNKTEWLKRQGILNAWQLRQAPDSWIKKNLSITTLKTVWELRGTPCLEVEEAAPAKQSILTSRTFMRDINDKEELKQSLARYVANAGQKLRVQGLLCGYIQVFLQSNRFKGDYHSQALGVDLSPATAYTPDLITQAHRLLEKMYLPLCTYKRAGVVLSHLSAQGHEQDQLFDEPYQNSRKDNLMRIIDQYNRTTNHSPIFLAAQGTSQMWHMDQSHKSKRFTTRWDEILEVSI